jgi:UDP-glucose 4-epimerase
MKILITGGAGFIGSNIADALIQLRHKVIVLDNLATGKLENVNIKAKFYSADILDRQKVVEIFKTEKPNIVIHNAAQIDVRKSVEDPSFDANINILGSINILKSCVENKVKKIIFASSGGTIYGECKSKAPDEKSFANPLSPYGIAKYCVENYIRFFSMVHNLKFTILRYANVYGPRQDPYGEAGVVAIFAKRMLANEPVNIFGDGRQMRDYVFIGDIVNANIKALSKGDNEIINIGTKKLVSVLDLIRIMSKITAYAKKPVMKPKREGELFKNFLNFDKAVKVLGWKPQVDINEGIKRTIDYFKMGIKG